MTKGYYDSVLAGERLRRAYEMAPPRVQQYLQAEIEHILRYIRPGDRFLEVGCGYGRILAPLASRADLAIGIDTSLGSLVLGRRMLDRFSNIRLLQMNALRLAFGDGTFDCVACIQNGISAFHVDQKDLLRESIRVTRPGGMVLFSSYSERFWENRLEWFRLQAEAGLLGEIDFEKTADGVIVCKDGFTATTVEASQFLSLTADLDVETSIVEVNASSLFCEMIPRPAETTSP